MLNIQQIKSFYPDFLKSHKKHILREYLQYKILECIFESSFSADLTFMGGTAIHILYGSRRFSEDLDFDNRGLNADDFARFVSFVSKRLQLQGYKPETRIITKKAFRAYLKFPDVLYQNNITPHKQEKLSLQIDVESQNFPYVIHQPILNKFDVFQRINAVPADVLLSQKILCLFNRPRLLGRDFYDIIFLLGLTRPEFTYLKQKLDITDAETLKNRLLTIGSGADFKRLSVDVQPFLYRAEEAKKIEMFPELIRNIHF